MKRRIRERAVFLAVQIDPHERVASRRQDLQVALNALPVQNPERVRQMPLCR